MLNNGFHSRPPQSEASDEELMQQLVAGAHETLGLLYQRYARFIFHLAAKSLDRPAAEEVVQEVFFAVWHRAVTFDPERGPFRPWALQIARYRILNELRRLRRQPQAEPDPEDLPDESPEPAEAVWQKSRRAALQAAFAELPPPQRQALGLAFFEDLSHEQVAAVLNLPLGTAKTRIRDGLQKLRSKLVPQMVALTLMGLLTVLGLRYHAERTALQRDEHALALVTASDTANLGLASALGVPTETRARYCGRARAVMAVVTFSHFSPTPAGQSYHAWVRHGERWTSLGTA